MKRMMRGIRKDEFQGVTGLRPFACDECNFRTNWKNHLNRHKRIHTGEKPFACDVCDYRSNDRGNLRMHKRTHTGERPYSCDECDFRAIRRDHLQKHKKMHEKYAMLAKTKHEQLSQPIDLTEDDDPVKDEVIIVSSFSLSDNHPALLDANDSQNSAEPEGSNQESELSKDSPLQPSVFGEHSPDSDSDDDVVFVGEAVRNEQEEVPFEDYEGFSLPDQHFDFFDHHLAPSRYCRPQLDESYAEGEPVNDWDHSPRETLNWQERTPFEEYAYNQSSFKSNPRRRFNRRMRIYTGEKPYACYECDFRSNQKTHLIRHIRIHTGEKPFACQMCDYRTNEKGNLKTHERRHRGEKPFACDECDFKADRRDRLRKHQRIHGRDSEFIYTGNSMPMTVNERSFESVPSGSFNHAGKPYFCPFCDHTATRKVDLQRHLWIHTGEKPYTCYLCDYRATRARDLQFHMRKHTGEKPFVCDKCDFKTIYKHHLARHQITHAGEMPYACDECDFRTKTRGYLILHKKSHLRKKLY